MVSDHITRRDVLATTGATGLTAIGVAGVAEAEDTTTIVEVKRGDIPVKTTEVPSDWWAHVKSVDGVSRDLNKEYGDHPAIEIGISSSTETLQGRRKKVIIANGAEDSAIDLPDQVNGVPVIPREGFDLELHDCHPPQLLL